MTILPTGTQYAITHGETTAVVAEVGATLRSFRVGGTEVFWTYPDDAQPVQWAGTTLVPWPNRIRDGRYVHDEVEQLLPVNEHPLHNALHGLAHALEWRLVRRSADAVTLAAVIYPQPGWPGVLEVETTHTVTEHSLTISWQTRNVGNVAVPFGYGCHPYFAFGSIDDLTVSSPFGRELRVDDRLLPTELGEVSEEYDFREPRALGELTLDTAFTGADGAWEIQMTGDGRAVTVWADERHRWAQIYTHPGRGAIAVEPMTCGPDAFNAGPTHDDLVVLGPGDTARGTWGVRVGY